MRPVELLNYSVISVASRRGVRSLVLLQHAVRRIQRFRTEATRVRALLFELHK